MANKWKKVAAVAVSLAMASSIAVGMTGCKKELVVNIDPVDYANYTRYTYTSTSPSNWNPLTNEDNNDTQIMNYIASAFHEFDYKFEGDQKFKGDGTINKEGIKAGEYTVNYSAATKLEDVTANYIGQYGLEKAKHSLKVNLKVAVAPLYNTPADKPEGFADKYTTFGANGEYCFPNAAVPTGKAVAYDSEGFPYYLDDVPAGKTAEGSGEESYYIKDAPAGATVLGSGADQYYETDPVDRAYKITLRQDLKWDDGTAINADSFIYSMQEQLNPLFYNYRAQEYYSGNMILHNAEAYVKQGTTKYKDFITVNPNYKELTMDNITAGSDGILTYNGKKIYISTSGANQWGSKSVFDYYTSYIGPLTNAMKALKNKADPYGYIGVTKADADLITKMIKEMNGYNYETASPENLAYYAIEWLEFCFVPDGAYDSLEWSEVGMQKIDDYSFIIVTDNPLTDILNDDGSLAYGAAYYLSQLPLVKKDLYESCKQEPVAGSTLWTSNYNSSVATTASWGPYKLKSFRTGVEYELVKNENWYGYDLPENKGQYQTDRIYCRNIPEWNTAWQYFQKGGIDGIGIDVSIANDYRNSERTYFTPDDLTVSLHFQSNETALTKEKGNALLKYTDFRKALSLGIDRAEYAATVTTSSKAAFGYFNDMYYYDVANGGVYRDTDQAKEALLRVYGYTYDETTQKWSTAGTTFNTMQEAYDSITGYNLTEARKLIDSAYDAALAAGDIDANGKVTLKLGFSEDNSSSRRYFNYLQKAWSKLLEGTKLQGRLNLTFDGSYGNNWATDFIDNGKYDICCVGGWTGGDWNMPYIIGSYIRDNRYASGWNPDGKDTEFEFTIKEANGEGTADYTGTHTIKQWFLYLNGTGEKDDPSFTNAPMTSKLDLIAKLEEKILLTYWSCPTISAYSASLMSYKCDYISYDYNTFMTYGGIQYLTYNYTDAEWKDFVYSQSGHTLNYK